MQTAWRGKDERTYEALHRATDQHGLELGGSGHGEARDGHDGGNREGEVHFRDAGMGCFYRGWTKKASMGGAAG